MGRFLEMRARRKAAAASGNLLKLIPAIATTLDGEQIPVKTLKIGDRIRVLLANISLLMAKLFLAVFILMNQC